MAKKVKGIHVDYKSGVYSDKCIVIDKSGVPWVIDPSKGSITLAQVNMPATTKKATK